MRYLFGRKLNRMAMYGALAAVVVVNAAGSALDWWPASMWAIAPMLVTALSAGWLFGVKDQGTAP